MGRYEEPPDLIRKIEELERRLRSLELSPRLGSAAIDDGSLTVALNGVPMLYVGELSGGNAGYHGLEVFREDGTLAFIVGGNAFPYQYWAMQDRTNHIVASDDAASGEGLARPYIPYQVYTGDSTLWPGVVGGSFSLIQTLMGQKQHPKLHVEVAAICTDGTTSGQVRIFDYNNSTQLGSTWNVPTGTTGIIGNAWDVTPSAGWGSAVNIGIDARRTAGAGTMRIMTYMAYGRQT